MARRLGNVQNRATFIDNLSPERDEIVLFWRHPTTEERVEYSNTSMRREGDEIVVRKGSARQKAGYKILTGFRFGDFEDEKGEKFSSDPKHKDYRENWKDIVMDGGADLVELLAAQVFDSPCTVTKNKAETKPTKITPTEKKDAPDPEDISGNSKETSSK